jgi:hypothetical protein
MEMGRKRKQSKREYSASKDLHYICNIIKGGCIGGLGCRNTRIEGKA